MRFSSWLDAVRSRRKSGRSVRARATRLSRAADVQISERLENRVVPTVTVSPTGPSGDITLFVSSDSGDAITVRVSQTDSTLVEVLANGVAVASTPTVLAAEVTHLDVQGGDGNNVIDLTGVTASDYSNPLIEITIDGGDGNDSITGSDDFGELISGGNGNDTLIGGAGDDTVAGNDGND